MRRFRRILLTFFSPITIGSQMAISRPVRPALIVSGVVVGHAPRQAYDQAARRYTDEVIGYNVTISQEGGAQVSVRYDVDASLPAVLSRVAVYAEVTESREYGASLIFDRNVTADDLEKINASLSVKA